ncbi:DUF6308 family protein [Micromonospora sp. NPDC007271]|uniref:DUF6308 family protein n=1 Tax=Micromonospora sp. NPDC007271 TaxID=3154587 RepID=UPI0034060055
MSAALTGAHLDFTSGFEGDVLGPVPIEKAARRILAYCTDPRSGWGVYDLAAIHARKAGMLDEVTAWSLLLANALNAQVTLGDAAAFERSRRGEFASLLGRIPPEVDLDEMIERDLDRVIAACSFGFTGVWGPKATKLAALFRPRSVPVLDGHIAVAFGFGREAFSDRAVQRSLTRQERIAEVVRALARGIAAHRPEIAELRALVEPTVPEVQLISDLRLVDMALWTSQDDRQQRRAKQGKRWEERPVGPRLPIEDFEAQPLPRLALETE